MYSQHYRHIVFFLLIGMVNPAYSQFFVGISGGTNVTHNKLSDASYSKIYECRPGFGWQAGVQLQFSHSQYFGLQADVLYSQKSRVIVSKTQPRITNKSSLNYVDIPILFRFDFQGRHLQWYLGAGPDLNFWLSGAGYVEKFDQYRGENIRISYEMNFGDYNSSTDKMNIQGSNRVQMSFGVGTGFYWNVRNGNRAGLDLRMSFGQTYLGSDEQVEIPIHKIQDNFYTRNTMLSCSFSYSFKTGWSVNRSRKSRRR